MQYDEFVSPVKKLAFIGDDSDRADAAVKAALGILVSQLEESAAREVTSSWPEPLTFERLRSHQARRLDVSAEEYVQQLATQIKISPDDARTLAGCVLGIARSSLEEQRLKRMQEQLPEDWNQLIPST